VVSPGKVLDGSTMGPGHRAAWISMMKRVWCLSRYNNMWWESYFIALCNAHSVYVVLCIASKLHHMTR
jgi:hypothetical protein